MHSEIISKSVSQYLKALIYYIKVLKILENNTVSKLIAKINNLKPIKLVILND